MSFNGTETVLKEVHEVFDAQSGFVTQERWGGTEAGLRALQITAASSGRNTSLSNTEGVWELSITAPDPDRNPDGSADEQITDDWAISTQFVEIEVWADEGLRKFLFNNAIPNPGPVTMGVVDAAISTYRSTVEDNLRNFYKPDGSIDDKRTGPTPKANFRPKYANGDPIVEADELNFLTLLYDQVIKKVDKSRTARISVVRRRTIAASSASRFIVSNVNRAYTPSAFYSTFGVPAAIQALLPAAPSADDTPPGTTWAWALVVQDAETSGTAVRVQERLEWVFAPVRNFSFVIA